VEIFQNDEAVINALVETSANTAAVRTNSPEDLQRILTGIENNLRNQ
jgi:hypothetical protein